MKIKNISKILTLGILLNSIPIGSFAGVLSEDGRYETFIDSGITISDILEEQKSKIKIEGNTLVVNELGKEVEPGTEGAMLKSSFEDNLVTQEMINNGEEKQENLGKYKVEYKVTGKNLFDISMWNDIVANNSLGTFIINEDDSITLSKDVLGDFFLLSGATGDAICSTREQKYLIECDSNKTYTISYNSDNALFGSSWVIIYDEDYNRIGMDRTISHLTTYTFTVPNNAKYIGIRFGIGEYSTGNITISNIQLEEGSVATEYEPYKESVNTFYLNSPLLKGDTIEYINGQATHVKRSDEVIIDGSRYIQSEETAVENKFRWNLYHSPSVDNILNTHIVTLNSDRYKCISSNETWFCTNEGLAQNNIGHNIYLYLEKYSDGSNTSKESLLNELKSNPTKIIYQLASPIYEPIKADLSVQLFEGATHISNNSNIPATMEITVDRTINRAVEAIELAKINPTLENLSKARMWTNLLDDSIKKDELQNEINDITDIEDLQLERKTVTSNIDVYVKSQNMLLMSLSTNSITFEDFSGVEDIVKENAINISINSSLPYNLNAYLATEIQNGDGTNIMNKDIFSIKESSELNYQTFSDVNNKLILKENCRSGNNQKHNIDLKLNGGIAHEKDVYKTVIKFEAEQQ